MITHEDLVKSTKLKQLVDQALAKDVSSIPLHYLPNAQYTLTEYEECILLVDYLLDLLDKKLITHFTHIPNETYTTSRNAKRKNKLQGVRPGFPDYIILTNTKILIIEMKRSKGGVVSDYQQSWINQLELLGITVKVCYGFEEAREFIDTNLS